MKETATVTTTEESVKPRISKSYWTRSDDKGRAYGFLVVDHKTHNISFKTFLNDDGVKFDDVIKFVLNSSDVKEELDWYAKHTRRTAYRVSKHKTKTGGTNVRISTYVPVAGQMCMLNSSTAFTISNDGLTKSIHRMHIGTFAECIVKLYGIKKVEAMIGERAVTIHHDKLRTIQPKHVTTKCTKICTTRNAKADGTKHHSAKAKVAVKAEAAVESKTVTAGSRVMNYTTKQWEVDAFDRHYRSGKVTRVSAHTRRRHCLEEN